MMRNNVFLTIRVAFVGFSLTLCSSLHAAAANPQKVADTVYTKALYDKASKTMFLAGKPAQGKTDVETTLAKVQYDATAQTWSEPTKLTVDGNLGKNKTIADLTLVKNNDTFPVVITDDKKLHVITDGAGTHIESADVLKDATTPAADDAKTIKAIASDGKDYIFAAVSEKDKDWSAHDGDARGIAVAKVTYVAGLPTEIKQVKPADLGNTNPAALALPAAAATKMAPLTAATPLAFKVGDGTGIDGAELMENVSMHYASEVGAAADHGTLFVGLQGVTRNDKYAEGGVSSLVLGKLDTTSSPAKFELASATPAIKAPYIDILTAHQKVAIANCVYAVEHALQSTVNDPKKPLEITDHAKALAYRELLALGASIIAASAGVTIKSADNATAKALGLAIAKAVAKRATTLTFDNTSGTAADGTNAAAASVVAGTFAGAWLGKVIGVVAAGKDTATDINTAKDDIKKLYKKTGTASTAFNTAQADGNGFEKFAAHAADATNGLGTKLETGINQHDLASDVVAKYNDETIFKKIDGSDALKAKLNRLVYESKIAVLGNASAAAQTGVAAAGYTIAAVAAKIKDGVDDAAVNAILPHLSLIAQAFAKAIAINPVVGVEAMWAVNKLLDAYGSVEYKEANLDAKLAAAKKVTDEYIANIRYADAALAVKKAAKLAQATPTPGDVHPIVAAVAAGAALDATILAAKTKQLTDETKIKDVTELADALDAWDAYVAGPTKDTAKDLLTKTSAYAGVVADLKDITVGNTDTHAKFEDDANGYSTTTNVDGAEATRVKVATFLVDATTPANGVNAKIPVLGDTATVLHDLVDLKELQKDAKKTDGTDVKAADAAAAVKTYADQFGTLKVAANTAAHMVASYSAPRDADFNFCGKTAMLDAKSRLDDNIKHEVAVFDANGDDALALTAGTMKTMTVGTAGPGGANHYLIANIVTQAPGQRAGSLFISGTKNMLCALPLKEDSGEIAKMINNVPDFTKAARNMYELPRIDYASVRVGGTATLFSGAWVNDIIVEGTRVYVVLGGYKADFMGIFYSDAITNTDNVITGWTTWKRYKGAQTTKRYLTAALDNTAGLAFVQAEDNAPESIDKFYPINSIAYLPFPTTAITNAEQYDEVIKAVNPTPVINGVVNMFEFDHETPGIATDKASFGVALLYDSLVLFQTGEFTNGSYVATIKNKNSITIPGPTHANDFKAIAPLSCAAFVANATENQGWLVVGGYNGLVGITQADAGDGFKNAASPAEVYERTQSKVISLKDDTDKPFHNVRQVLGHKDTIYIVTKKQVQCAKVEKNAFASKQLITQDLHTPKAPYVCTYASILDNDYMVVCTTKGLTLIKNHNHNQAAAAAEEYEVSADGVTLQAQLIEHKGAKELLVLFSDIVTKRSMIKRYAVDLNATNINNVLTPKDIATDILFDSSFILSFACDGDTIVASAPEHNLVYRVDIETKKSTVINTDFDRPGLAAYDQASGNFLIPGAQGIGVK